MNPDLRQKLRWLILPAGAVLAGLALFDGGLLRQHEYHTRLDSLLELEQRLEAENQWLREDIELLRSEDKDRLEQEARAQGMIRPGERVFHLTTDSLARSEAADSSKGQP